MKIVKKLTDQEIDDVFHTFIGDIGLGHRACLAWFEEGLVLLVQDTKDRTLNVDELYAVLIQSEPAPMYPEYVGLGSFPKVSQFIKKNLTVLEEAFDLWKDESKDIEEFYSKVGGLNV